MYPDGMNSHGSQDLSVARALRIHDSAQALLYDIQRRVGRGYTWWTQGEVDAAKILAVMTKIGTKYGAYDAAWTRSRRKASGRPSAVLIVYPVRHDPAGYTTRYRFVLLGTAHLDGETMYDARQRPLRVTLYHDAGGAFCLQPAVNGASGERSKVTYTWQLTPRAQQQMERDLREAAGRELKVFMQTVTRYRTLPMTSGYRRQLKAALQSAVPAWRRNNRPDVMAIKQQVKAGTAEDPIRAALPYIAGFPTLYADPALTLGMSLRINEQRRRDIARAQREQVARDHSSDHEVTHA